MERAWKQVGNLWYGPYADGFECIAVEPETPGGDWRALVVQPHGWADLEGSGPTRESAVMALRTALAELAGEDPCPY